MIQASAFYFEETVQSGLCLCDSQKNRTPNDTHGCQTGQPANGANWQQTGQWRQFAAKPVTSCKQWKRVKARWFLVIWSSSLTRWYRRGYRRTHSPVWGIMWRKHSGSTVASGPIRPHSLRCAALYHATPTAPGSQSTGIPS